MIFGRVLKRVGGDSDDWANSILDLLKSRDEYANLCRLDHQYSELNGRDNVTKCLLNFGSL